LNKAVKRNITRFPGEFMFQLTKIEFDNLLFQNGRSNWDGRRTPPNAFAEQGVAMLSGVPQSELAKQKEPGQQRPPKVGFRRKDEN
jgi:hypothetical protein